MPLTSTFIPLRNSSQSTFLNSVNRSVTTVLLDTVIVTVGQDPESESIVPDISTVLPLPWSGFGAGGGLGAGGGFGAGGGLGAGGGAGGPGVGAGGGGGAGAGVGAGAGGGCGPGVGFGAGGVVGPGGAGGGGGGGGGGAAAWRSSTVTAFTVIAPCRSTSLVFGDTEYVTRPSPCPSRGVLTEIQLASAVALHVQSRVVLTVTAPLPPVAGKLEGFVLAMIWQREPEGEVTVLTDVPPHRTAAADANRTKKKTAERRTTEGPGQRAMHVCRQRDKLSPHRRRSC